MANSAQAKSTTQQFLDIFDITNDFIVMNEGAVSLILTVSAMNFGLLSEEEQDATIYAYAALLNSLSFPIEIVIRSQPKDVTTYLKLIAQKEAEIVNPVYKQRIREYRTFVESMVQEQNVLDKKFFITIPMTAVEMGLTTQSVIPGAKNKPLSSFERNFIIDKAKTNLIPRRDHVVDQLARIGLYSRQLTTQELIQLLYSAYNPESFEGQQVTDTQNYTTPLVQAQFQGDYTMTDHSLPVQTPITPQVPVEQPATTPVAATPQVSVPTESPSFTQSAPVVASPSTPTPTQPSIVETPTITPPVSTDNKPDVSPLGVTTPTGMSTPTSTVSPINNLNPVQPLSTPTQTPPPVSPTITASVPAVGSTDEAQDAINQTLSQIGTAPVTPPAVPEV